MLNQTVEQIDAAAILKLIEDETPESKTLEYKRHWPRKQDSAKKEFLADVTSFANASGGDILYGIEEARTDDGKKTGKPKCVYGLSGEEPDEAIRSLQSIINSGVDPRITPNVQFHPIKGFTGDKKVLLLRIPRSWSAPHMVKTQNSRFYTRNSAGKQPLDAREIRMAFALSEELPRRMQEFRNDRLARIVADEGPVRLKNGGKFLLHLIPVSAVEAAEQLDMEAILRQSQGMDLFDYGSLSTRYNLDGLLKYTRQGETLGQAYI